MSTLVSLWLASIGLDPTIIIDEYLMDVDKKVSNVLNKNKVITSIQEGVAIDTEAAIEARALSIVEKETLDTLKRLKSYFPYSLDGNTLLSNMFWEYSSVWQNCITDLRPLYAALAVADKIPCPHTRQSKFNFYTIMNIIITF